MIEFGARGKRQICQQLAFSVSYKRKLAKFLFPLFIPGRRSRNQEEISRGGAVARRREITGRIAPFNSPRHRASARTLPFGSEVVGNANSRIPSKRENAMVRYLRKEVEAYKASRRVAMN